MTKLDSLFYSGWIVKSINYVSLGLVRAFRKNRKRGEAPSNTPLKSTFFYLLYVSSFSLQQGIMYYLAKLQS